LISRSSWHRLNVRDIPLLAVVLALAVALALPDAQPGQHRGADATGRGAPGLLNAWLNSCQLWVPPGIRSVQRAGEQA
jgi:hypothetical protein